LARILLAGLAVPGSGLTRVLSALARSLLHCHTISYFGLGESPALPSEMHGVSFYACPLDAANPSTPQFFCDVLDHVKPALVFLMGQPVWLEPLLWALQPYRNSLRVVLYAPLEGNAANAAAIRPLQMVDDCILYTEYARRSVLSLAAERNEEDPSFHLPALHVLPHGVDTQTFYPVPESRADLRRRLFPGRPELHDAFIVLNANVPYPRKRLDLTIRAFARFAQNKPDSVFLYLHLVRADDRICRGLRECVRAEGIEHRTLINLMNPAGERLSDASLNLLYNACDVGINTAMGEGWGLVNFEHAATGAAQVLPNHSTFIEHWTGAAELVEIAGTEYFFHEHTEMYVVSPEDAARKLDLIYRDPHHRRAVAKAARARATAEKFRWSVIGNRLDEILIRRLMNRP
jgi:D-inositol-3-phosphate glycosyltransferase